MLLVMDAGALGAAGRPAEGLAPVDAAIAYMSVDTGTSVLPEFRLLKGDLLAARAAGGDGDASEADHWYRLAFEQARDLGARMPQLRAATRLCRPGRDATSREANRGALSAVLDTFTEGFETADLVEARQALGAAAGG